MANEMDKIQQLRQEATKMASQNSSVDKMSRSVDSLNKNIESLNKNTTANSSTLKKMFGDVFGKFEKDLEAALKKQTAVETKANKDVIDALNTLNKTVTDLNKANKDQSKVDEKHEKEHKKQNDELADALEDTAQAFSTVIKTNIENNKTVVKSFSTAAAGISQNINEMKKFFKASVDDKNDMKKIISESVKTPNNIQNAIQTQNKKMTDALLTMQKNLLTGLAGLQPKPEMKVNVSEKDRMLEQQRLKDQKLVSLLEQIAANTKNKGVTGQVIKENRPEAKERGALVGGVAKVDLGSWWDKLLRLGLFGGLLGGLLSGNWGPFVRTLWKFADAGLALFKNNFKRLAAQFDIVLKPLRELGETVFRGVGKVLKGLGTRIMDNLIKPLGRAIGEVAGNIMKPLKEIFEKVGKNLTEKIVIPIKEAFEKIGKKIGEKVIKPISTAFKNVGKTILEKVAKPIGTALKGIGGKIASKIVKPFATIFKSIGGKILGKLGGVFGKLGGKMAGKAAGKGIAKLGKAFLSKIPGVSMLISIPFAISRFKKGDVVGGLLELASGFAGNFPGIGTVISVAIDAFMIFRDIKGMGQKKEGEVKPGGGGGKKILKNLPGIGTILGFIDGFKLWKSGDKAGALKEIGRGLSTLIPGGGFLFDAGVALFEKAQDFLATPKGEAAAGKAKEIGMATLKNLPVIGTIMGIAEAFKLWKSGDKSGALSAMGRGLATILPGGGFLFDAASALFDKGKEFLASPKGEAAVGKTKEVGMAVLKNLPGIGSVLGIVDGVKLWKSGDKAGGLYAFGRAMATLIPGGGMLFDATAKIIEMGASWIATGGESTDQGIAESGPTILDSIKQKITGVIDYIKAIPTQVVDMFSSAITNMGDFLAGAITSIGGAIGGAFTKISTAVASIIPAGVMEKLKGIGDALLTPFKIWGGIIAQMFGALKVIGNAILNNFAVKAIAKKLGFALPTIPDIKVDDLSSLSAPAASISAPTVKAGTTGAAAGSTAPIQAQASPTKGGQVNSPTEFFSKLGNNPSSTNWGPANPLSSASAPGYDESDFDDVSNRSVEPKQKKGFLGKLFGGGEDYGEMPVSTASEADMIKGSLTEMEKNGITSKVAQSNILSQFYHESRFKPSSESLKYKPGRLLKIFPSKIKSKAQAEEIAAGGEQAIGNAVYGGMYGNGPDEGYKYRGRGLIQLTFKGNYKKYGALAGLDLVNNPSLVNEPKESIDVALAYLKDRTKGSMDDIGNVGRAVGPAAGPGGMFFKERTRTAKKYLKMLEKGKIAPGAVNFKKAPIEKESAGGTTGEIGAGEVKSKLTEKDIKPVGSKDGKPLPPNNAIRFNSTDVKVGGVNSDVWYNLYGMSLDYYNAQKKRGRKKISSVNITSGHRTFQDQMRLWNGATAETKRKKGVANPYKSGAGIHGTGFALDINSTESDEMAVMDINGRKPGDAGYTGQSIMKTWGFRRFALSKGVAGESADTYNPTYKKRNKQEHWHIEPVGFSMDKRLDLIAANKEKGMTAQSSSTKGNKQVDAPMGDEPLSPIPVKASASPRPSISFASSVTPSEPSAAAMPSPISIPESAAAQAPSVATSNPQPLAAKQSVQAISEAKGQLPEIKYNGLQYVNVVNKIELGDNTINKLISSMQASGNKTASAPAMPKTPPTKNPINMRV
jgi:putative chitinase